MDDGEAHAAVERPEQNGLGIAGFVVSLAGLVFTGGLLSPVGLILSLVALAKPPRGFAIAGVVIGVVGTLTLIFVGFAIVVFILALLGIVAVAAMSIADVTSDGEAIRAAVRSHVEQHGAPPLSLNDLGSLSEDSKQDPIGTFYRFEMAEDGTSFTITSAGFDQRFDTDDEFVIWFSLTTDEFDVIEAPEGFEVDID